MYVWQSIIIGLLVLPAGIVAAPSSGGSAGISISVNHDDGGRTSMRHVKNLAKALQEKGCPAVIAGEGDTADLVFDPSPPDTVREKYSQSEFITQAVTSQGNATVRGAVLVKASTGIADLKSLQGERIAFVSEQSWSGYRLPQKLLQKSGVTPKRDTVFFAKNHAGAVTMMLHGDVFAAAVAEPLAQRWADANDLSVIEVTDEVETGGWWLRSSVAGDERQRCAAALGQLSKSSLKALPGWIAGFEVVGR